ncbi:MAG: acyl carrier protein [Actinomycetia bacterium]|nr:acyl carrier protein [Actinomycetes bacterium]
MTPEEARAVLVASIQQVAPETDPDSVPGDADLLDELELDSMDVLNVVVAVHDRCGLEIAERDYPKLLTLDSFTDHLVTLSEA